MNILIYAYVFIIGACLGSFYNVLAFRLIKGISIIWPRSYCTWCNRTLGILDLIPIFSYIFLRGKCRYCGGKISPQHLVVETLTGCLTLFIFLKYGLTIIALKVFLTISALLICGISDLNYKLISSIVVYIPIVVNIIFGLYQYSGSQLVVYIITIIITACIFWLLSLTGKMGDGDIFIFILIASLYGPILMCLAFFWTSIVGLIVSVIVLYKTRNIKFELPYVPIIGIGSFIPLVFPVGYSMLLDFFRIFSTKFIFIMK